MLRVLPYAAAIAALAGSSLPAAAQTRSFACSVGGQPGPSVTVTVTGPASIAAGPIRGRTYQLRQSRGNPLAFETAGLTIQIAPDQNSIQVRGGPGEQARCFFRGGQTAVPVRPPKPAGPVVTAGPRAPDAPPPPPQPVAYKNITAQDFLGDWSQVGGGQTCLGCNTLTVTAASGGRYDPTAGGYPIGVAFADTSRGLQWFASASLGPFVAKSGRLAASGSVTRSDHPDLDGATAAIELQRTAASPYLDVTLRITSRSGAARVVRMTFQR